MTDMQIIYKKLDEIHKYENNPRINKDAVAYVKNSIENFGFKNPIIIDKDGVIVCGHTRYDAAKKLKLKEVPCIIADDLTEEQVKAYRLADNKVAEKAEWDFDLLADELADIFEIDMEALGFELDIYEEEPEAVEDDYEVEVPAEPKAKLGDIYQLGQHRLMCGDSTNLHHVEQLVAGCKVDLVVTDPPYNVAVNDESEESLKARNRRTDGLKVSNDNMRDSDFHQFLLDVFTNYFSIMKDGAGIYVFYADSEVVNFVTAFEEAGFHFAQNCIWNKQQFVMTRKDYHYKHEPILYGWKKGQAHQWYTDRKQSSVWDFDRPFKSEHHPTMKPIPLVSYPINNSSKPGDYIVDLFGGSGSTLIACEQMNRTCYTMELDPRYVDVIIDRWEKFTGEKAVLLNDVDTNFGKSDWKLP